MAKEMMKETANSVSKGIATMKNTDVSPIREDLKAIKADAEALRGDAVILGRDLKEEGKRQLSKAEVRAKEAMEDAKERGRDTFEDMTRFVQANPGQSLAIAFVGGIIASMLLGGRR